MASSRILIVEDERLVAEGIQSCLENFDYEVVGVVGSGEKALEVARDTRPDLTLMDINLEGKLDGTEVAKIFRKQYGIPVVYLTACADEDTLQRVKSTVPLGFILKPFNERELRSSVEIALYRKKLEQQANFGSDWGQHAIDSLGDGIIATDQDNRIKFMNCAAEKITGWFFLEAHERQLAEILNLKRSDASRVISHNDKTDQRRQRANVHISNVMLLQSDGVSKLAVDVIANPIFNTDNEWIGTSLILRKVEDSSIDEDGKLELRQDDLVHEKMSALRELVEGLAHGINNSLTGSLGFLELLRRHGKISEDFQKWADSAMSGCRDAAELLNTVRKTCNSIPIKPVQLNLNELVCGLVDKLISQLGDNIKIQCHATTSKILIEGDRAQIEQVVLNLIVNAALAMPDGGEIEVNISRESLQAPEGDSTVKKSGSYGVVWVKDSGIGIAPEAITRIFDPFYTTLRDGKVFGKGLGLTLAYGIMQGHGGWINVESVENEGSVFRLYFPELVV